MTGTVAIVGLGRIGLPLALSFADRGVDVVGVDRDARVLELVAEGRMPFRETGTPTHVHVEIDVSQIRGAIDDLLPLLRHGQTIILRSTVAPGTTEWVAGYVEQRRGFTVGEDVHVAHVPERIAENHFLDEIASLPCIIGGVGAASGERAADLFGVFGTEILQTTPVHAELAKI